jgi:hypothetical protein
LVPQVDAACVAQIRCGSAPLLTKVQVPVLPARLQAWQKLLQELLQHTPSAQKLLRHSLAAEQDAPGGFRPQLLMTPFIPQVLGAMHIALLVHEPKHWVALQ